MKRDLRPQHYVGIEAIPALADAAEALRHDDALIIRADFVREPIKMFVAADVIAFSGSLNTLGAPAFYDTLAAAWEATAKTLVFNFLSSKNLAAASYLTWHEPSDVLKFVRTKTTRVRTLDDYLDGDCTISLDKTDE